MNKHEKKYFKSQMRSYLFTDHEKEYFKSRTPKKFVMSENGPVIEVGGIGNNTGTNEKIVWGKYNAASHRANKYLVTPLPTEKGSGRYRLEWH